MTHLKCPRCGANRERYGFHVRGQFCACGWRRDGAKFDPVMAEHLESVFRDYDKTFRALAKS